MTDIKKLHALLDAIGEIYDLTPHDYLKEVFAERLKGYPPKVIKYAFVEHAKHHSFFPSAEMIQYNADSILMFSEVSETRH